MHAAFVRAEVVHDDDVARLQRRHQELLDVGHEALAVDRAVDDAGRGDAVVAQRGEEGHGAPVAVRHLGAQRRAAAMPAVGARHVGLGPGLVDEDEAGRIDASLVALPPARAAAPRQADPARWRRRFFLKLIPSRRRKRQSVSQATTTPRLRSSASRACSVRSGFSDEPRQQPVPLARQHIGPLAAHRLGAALPVARARCDHFTTLATLTSNSAATARQDCRRATDATTRSRRSRE